MFSWVSTAVTSLILLMASSSSSSSLNLIVQAVGSDDDHNNDASLFHSWLQRHDKSYENEQEFNHRLNVFLFNSKLVEKHNLAFEMGYTTYKMTTNNLFSDLTDEEFSRTHLMESQNCSATTSTTMKPAHP